MVERPRPSYYDSATADAEPGEDLMHGDTAIVVIVQWQNELLYDAMMDRKLLRLRRLLTFDRWRNQHGREPSEQSFQRSKHFARFGLNVRFCPCLPPPAGRY